MSDSHEQPDPPSPYDLAYQEAESRRVDGAAAGPHDETIIRVQRPSARAIGFTTRIRSVTLPWTIDTIGALSGMLFAAVVAVFARDTVFLLGAAASTSTTFGIIYVLRRKLG